MPAPERTFSEIKGKDAEDTAERQMGAFKHLLEIEATLQPFTDRKSFYIEENKL